MHDIKNEEGPVCGALSFMWLTEFIKTGMIMPLRRRQSVYSTPPC